MSVIKDILSNQTLTRTADGYELQRTYLVDEVGGTADGRIYAAMTTAGVPQIGDAHPVVPDVVVTNISATPATGATPNQFKVNVTYTVPSPGDIGDPEEDTASAGTIGLNTSLSQELTYRDVNGDFMIVEWHGGVISTKYAGVDVQRPQIAVSFKRTESTIPKSVIANYLGRVNSVAWSGFPSKTWLCTAVDVSEESTGVFSVDYAFSYKPDTWRVEVTVGLTQAQIEELPIDVDSGNGFGIFDVYKEADFNSLGLSF